MTREGKIKVMNNSIIKPIVHAINEYIQTTVVEQGYVKSIISSIVPDCCDVSLNPLTLSIVQSDTDSFKIMYDGCNFIEVK